MKITETLNDGLKREYAVIVAASELAAKLDAQVADVAKRIRMPGFRAGKVPLNLVKKMHGKAMTGDVLQSAINDGSQKVIADHKLRPALQPKIEVVKYDESSDLEFNMALEILPDVPAVSFEGLKLEKLVVPVADSEVEEALMKLAEQQKSFEAADAKHTAKTGDAVVIDFLGKLDGVAFDGGKGEGVQLELGSGSFIPGFEEQLSGLKAGDSKIIDIVFPENYQAENLKGKAATFDIDVKEVKTAKPVELNEELAKNFGLESLDKLKELLRGQLEREHDGLTRTYLKRKLLDALAADHDFGVPQSMVEAEFEQIWAQLQQEVGTDDTEKAKLEAEKDDYRAIAERRVRLGLILSDVGQKANVQISQQELSRLITQESMKYRGQEQQVMKYFQENEMAAAQLRAPLYEEKVVDHVLAQIEVTERTVSKDELEAAIQDESTDPKPTASKPKKTAKAKAKEESVNEESEQSATETDKPKKKAPSKKA
jgi:trigger factor